MWTWCCLPASSERSVPKLHTRIVVSHMKTSRIKTLINRKISVFPLKMYSRLQAGASVFSHNNQLTTLRDWPHLWPWHTVVLLPRQKPTFHWKWHTCKDRSEHYTVLFFCFFCLLRTSVSSLSRRKHSAGWISLTKLCMEAFMGRGTPAARLRQSCLSTGSQ